MNATQVLAVVLSLTVQASVVVVLTEALCRRCRRTATQCRLWTTCYAVLLCLVAAAVLLPHCRLLRVSALLDGDSAIQIVTLQTEVGRAVLLIWLAGAAVSSVRFVAGTFTTWRSLRRCRAADPARLPAGSDGLSPREDVVVERRRVRFLTGAQVAHPCCWQFHRPCVLLPEFVLRFGSDDVDFIVRHELEHLRRGHPLQLFLERLVGIVFWYHPVVWWASYRSALAREYACDEAAIDSPSDVAAYLRTLLRIVEETGPAERAAPGTLAFGLGAGVVACRARRLVRLARSGEQYSGPHAARSERLLPLALGACLAVAPLAWVPVDALAAPHTAWSPWPAWTARALHDFGVTVRDHETYDRRSRLHELREGSEFHPPPPGREAR